MALKMDLDKLRERSDGPQIKIELAHPKLKVPLYFVPDTVIMELANEDDVKKAFSYWGELHGTDPITSLEASCYGCESCITIHEKIPGGWDFITWMGDIPMTGTEYCKWVKNYKKAKGTEEELQDSK